MAKKKTKTRRLRKKLLHQYRLVVLNEDTFEERFSFKLSRLNVFVVGTLFTIALITGTILLIAFTPLREYIPGYSSTSLKLKAIQLTEKTDSLEQQLSYNQQLYGSIQKALLGDIENLPANNDSILNAIRKEQLELNMAPNRQDSLLRAEVAQEDKYNLIESASRRTNFVLFPPVTGSITGTFDPEEKHYAVDIAVAEQTPVKAVADGTVFFSEWTAQTGNVIIVEHNYGLISVYKHNSSLTKQQGDLVKAGEVIAIAGNTGEYTTGYHLHFELWSDGYPVNPMNFIDFEQ